MDDGERANKNQELLHIAGRYVAARQSEPRVVGIVLYGSLAVGRIEDLTPFSDIDVATILERDPPDHFTEHRLYQGADVDNLIFTIDRVAELVAMPEHLFQGGFLCYLTTALLAGADETILFDPTGKIAQMRSELRGRTNYERMAKAGLSSWIESIRRDSLPQVECALFNGSGAQAMDGLREAVSHITSILRLLTLNKNVESASAQLGIPAFADKRAQIQALIVPEIKAFEAYRDDLERIENLVQDRVYRRIEEELRRAGIADPNKQELVGDHDLFRAGNRLIELGRLTTETKASFHRSRFEQERGDVLEALDMIRYSTPWHAKHHCERLAVALCEVGLDMRGPIEEFVKSADFKRAVKEGVESGRASTESACRSGNGNGLGSALALCAEMADLLTPLMEPDPAV